MKGKIKVSMYFFCMKFVGELTYQMQHARECNAWAEKQQEERENQKLSAADDRKAVWVELFVFA